MTKQERILLREKSRIMRKRLKKEGEGQGSESARRLTASDCQRRCN